MPRKTYTPHPYQLQAAEFMASNAASGLLLQPGLGKTSISLMVVAALREAGTIKRVLLIAPLRVCYEVWPHEVAKWDFAEGLTVAVAHGPKKADALRSNAQIVCINPEGLPWLASEFARDTKLRAQFDTLIVDESTKFKNGRSQRFLLLRGMLDGFKRRHILTGTPAPRGLEDLFSQVFILDGGARLGKFITHFRRQYFTEKRNPWAGFSEWVPAVDAEERIHARISDVCLSMRAVDHLKLPDLIVNDIPVTIPRDAYTAYRAMERNFTAALASGDVLASNAAVMTGKLRQFANGMVYTDGEAFDTVHTAKLDALADLIEGCAGQPLLVGVAFLSEAREIQRMLKAEFGDVPYLGGGVAPAQTSKIVADWNAGKLPVLLAHPTSVAHGLNLQAGGYQLCWFALTWSQEEYEQFINRVYRQGQSHGVIVHRLLASYNDVPLSIETAMVERLADRDRTQSSLMSALRRNFK